MDLRQAFGPQARKERWVGFDRSAAEARALFPVLTAVEVRRAFAWARSAEGQRNEVREQVRAKILDLKLGKPAPEVVGKTE